MSVYYVIREPCSIYNTTHPSVQPSSALTFNSKTNPIWLLCTTFHSLFAQVSSPLSGLCSVWLLYIASNLLASLCFQSHTPSPTRPIHLSTHFLPLIQLRIVVDSPCYHRVGGGGVRPGQGASLSQGQHR